VESQKTLALERRPLGVVPIQVLLVATLSGTTPRNCLRAN
jgi:hypothetical protein